MKRKKHFTKERLCLATVLSLRSRGLSNSQIGKRLNVKQHDVDYLLRKSSIQRSRRELTWARWDIQFGQDAIFKHVYNCQSYRIAASDMGLSPASLMAYLSERGMTNIPQISAKAGKAGHRSYDQKRADLIVKYGKMGLSTASIATATGLSVEAIQKFLKARGLHVSEFCKKKARFAKLFSSQKIYDKKVSQHNSFAAFCRYYDMSVTTAQLCAKRLNYETIRIRQRCRLEFDIDVAHAMYLRGMPIAKIASVLQVNSAKLSIAMRRANIRVSKGRMGKISGPIDDETRRRLALVKNRYYIDMAKYRDTDKLLFLLRQCAGLWARFKYTKKYLNDFVDKFYYDKAFNNVYCHWHQHGRASFAVPSIDHIIPTARGGSWGLSNLHYITWFENRMKGSFTMVEWDMFRNMSHTNSEWFIRGIMARHKHCRECRIRCRRPRA